MNAPCRIFRERQKLRIPEQQNNRFVVFILYLSQVSAIARKQKPSLTDKLKAIVVD
jgi:hypothetical protein